MGTPATRLMAKLVNKKDNLMMQMIAMMMGNDREIKRIKTH